MKLIFIPWKGVSTKNIRDWNISAHFEVPESFNSQDFINKPLQLQLDNWVVMDCNISSEWSSYGYNWTHKTYWIKLDIILPDILAMWLIFKSNDLNLIVYKDWLSKKK